MSDLDEAIYILQHMDDYIVYNKHIQEIMYEGCLIQARDFIIKELASYKKEE